MFLNLSHNSEHVDPVISGTGRPQENRIFRGFFFKFIKQESLFIQIEKIFVEVNCKKYRITWENKNFDDMGTLKFEQVFITWYLTISRKETLISFSKALDIFVLNSVTDSTKLESADSGRWINDIK